MGRTLGFFESFPFLRMGSRPWAFVGSAVLSGVCVFKSGLSTPIRVSLIVVPDIILNFSYWQWILDTLEDPLQQRRQMRNKNE